MAVSDGCCTYMAEMDDVHQWLPSEVLRDIGIADPAERRRLAVVEDLATRLAGVLGSGASPGEMAATTHTRQPPSSYHRPQVMRGGGGPALRDHRATHAGAVAPPFMPLPLMTAPTAPRQAQAMGQRPAAALHQPRQLATALSAGHPHPLFRGAVATGAAQLVAMTRRGGGGGTGFFLPRTSTAVPARHHHHAAPRQCRAQRQRRGEGNGATATARRQQEFVAQATAANMVQMQQLAGAPATVRPELALPLEWTY